MKIFAIVCCIGFLVIWFLSFLTGINRKGRRPFIAALYLLSIVYVSYTGVYYATNFPDSSPDESAHIAYIHYLDRTGEVIPKFEDMHIFSNQVMKWSEEPNFEYQTSLVNYLCHPPLYYHIMRLAGGFSTTDSEFVMTIDKMKLRYFSMGIYILGLALCCYIGWSRIDRTKPWLHLLYVTIITSVPMLSFEFCSVSNDALTMLTCGICILGLIRFSEKNRNILTYGLIALGITGSLLTKLTAAMLCVIMAILVLFFTMIKEKSLKASLKAGFFITFPIYFIAIAYYVIVIGRYGTLPSLEVISSKEYFENTIYYVAQSDRVYFTFGQYIWFYIERFFLSWSGIETAQRFIKEYLYSPTSLAFELLWLFPVLLFIPRVHSFGKRFALPLGAGWASMVITFIYQFKSAYGAYLTRGYLGGFASRYYIPFVMIFGLSAVFIAQSLLVDNGFDSKTTVTTIKGDLKTFSKNLIYNQLIYALTLVFSFVLFYGNFPFFLLHFGKGLQ